MFVNVILMFEFYCNCVVCDVGGGGGGNYNTTEMSSGTFNKKKALTPELRSFEIQIQDLTFDKEIGRGAFGVVYKVYFYVFLK